jgi:hypothetical protein
MIGPGMAALLLRLGAATSNALRDATQAADVELIGEHDFGDDRAKRQILETVVSNLALTGKILNIEARKPFSTQVESGTCPRRLAWREEVRTHRWADLFPFPSVSLHRMQQLLAIVK